MSARVFNPMVMSEFPRKIGRSNSVSDSTGQVDGNSLQRVRRNLFGPVDHEDNLALVDRELAAASVRDTEKWSFDFIREKPVKSLASRYVWERVMPQRDNVPEPYALRRMTYLQKNADCTTTAANCSFKIKSPIKNFSQLLQKPTTSRRTKSVIKQSYITEYLKKSKRNSPKTMVGKSSTVDYKLRSPHLTISTSSSSSATTANANAAAKNHNQFSSSSS